EQSAENLDFEQAVFYRDQLSMLYDMQAKQAVYTAKAKQISSLSVNRWASLAFMS
ncbi:UvrB/UvrC motif-containing protein, partial [Burkholderia mallei]|uniref:UvrB/UvrC motif-containing protein n=1 Tax=Burkholderia mallei TaxID=13373 RepID=UPI001C535435